MNIDVRGTLASLLVGASESIDVLGTVGMNWLLPLDDIASLVDRRIPMRWLLRDPVYFLTYRDKSVEFLKSLKSSGWVVRILEAVPTINCVIVDRQQALMLSAKELEATGPAFLIRDRRRLQPVLDHFDRLWGAVDTDSRANPVPRVCASAGDRRHRVATRSSVDKHLGPGDR